MPITIEEIFFFLYHMELEPEKVYKLPINLRKYLIEKFIEQKENKIN